MSKKLRIYFAVSKKITKFASAFKSIGIGKMPEWSIGTVSKTVVPLRVPRVRIPVFPPTSDCGPDWSSLGI